MRLKSKKKIENERKQESELRERYTKSNIDKDRKIKKEKNKRLEEGRG